MANTLRILRGVDPNCGTSLSRMRRNKELREGWLRYVVDTDPKGKGWFQFLGGFVDPGAELELGTVMVNKTPEQGWRAGVTVPRNRQHGDPATECAPRWTVQGVDIAVARRECERLLAIPQGERDSQVDAVVF